MKFKTSVLFSVGLILLLAGCGRAPTLDDLDEWDLVWISDSSGWDVAEIYAEMIEEDTGKTVNVYDFWIGGLPIKDVLDSLNGNPPEQNRELGELLTVIPEAEVIVVYGNPEKSTIENNPGDWACFPGGTFYVNNCEADTFDLYVEHLGTVFEKIIELRDGKPTILRTFDAFNAVIPQRDGQAGYEDCIICWGTFNDAIHQAAKAHNIPIALVQEAWNGADYLKNPKEMGYTRDSVHPNEVGAEVIAQLLRELGYDPVSP